MNKKSRVRLLFTLAILMAVPVLGHRRRFFAPPPAPTLGDYQTAVNGRLYTVETVVDDEGNETRSFNRVSLSGETVVTLGEDSLSIADFVLTDESGETVVNIAAGECTSHRGHFHCDGTATIGEGDDATVVEVHVHGKAHTSRRTGITTVHIAVHGRDRDAGVFIGASGRGTLIVVEPEEPEEPETPEEPEAPTDGEETPV